MYSKGSWKISCTETLGWHAGMSDRFRVVVSGTHLDISRIWEIEFYHPIADISYDGRVDVSDFAFIGAQWTQQGVGLEADLVPDEIVDFDDLLFFCEFWLWP